MPITRRPHTSGSPTKRDSKLKMTKNKNTNSSSKSADINDTKNTVLMDCRHVRPTFMSYLCMFLSLGWIITVSCFLIMLPFLWVYCRPLFWVILGLTLLSAVYTADRDYQPAWGYTIGSWIMRNVDSYFMYRLEFEDLEAVKNAKVAIYIMEPHGVFPVALFWGGLRVIPNFEMLVCISSSIFTIPFMKHVLTWCGATNIHKDNISRYLKEGVNVNICAGGVQEIQFWGDNQKELVLFLKSRFGVTKLAMSHGVPIVPSICFGLDKAYDCWIISHPVLLTIARKIGFFPMLFTGLFGVPFGQPKPCPLCSIIGKPIYFPYVENPSSELVAQNHQIFLDAYVKLYNDNKHRFGMAQVPLRLA
jgi:1-acyl-sn-glycerol-3-phosphate acyltransferase